MLSEEGRVSFEPQRAEKKLPKSPFPAWLAFALTGWWRRTFIDRACVVTDLAGVKPGDIVLEIGCGPGFFTEALAERVAEGKVIAQDVQERMLEKLAARMPYFARSDNIEPLLVNSGATGLADRSVDVVFAANVFEEISREGETGAVAREMHRVLKTGGRLFLAEHWVSKARLREITGALAEAGFRDEELPNAPFYYTARYRKNR